MKENRFNVASFAVLCVLGMGLMPAAESWAGEENFPVVGVLGPGLPPAWKSVPAADRLSALKVAELDADRRLMERIYGLTVDSDSLVQDLAMELDVIHGDLLAMCRGARTIATEYTDDLIVNVKREVTFRQVVETLRKSMRRETKGGRLLIEEKVVNIERHNRDVDLTAVGSGAVPGSKGQSMIMSKRVAQMDAYRQLAERTMGLEISGQTTVRNFVLVSDRIQARMASALVKHVNFTDSRYLSDGSCEIDAELILVKLIETLESTFNRYGKGMRVTEEDFKRLSKTQERTVLKVTGRGAMRPGGPPETGWFEPYEEEVTIIRRVIGEGTVIK